MDINFTHGFDLPLSSLKSTDYAVVIDSLRAGATTAVCLELGAQSVIPIREEEELSEFSDDVVTIGESAGEKIEGFDLPNSPSILKDNKQYISGRKVILLSSNGSKIVRSVARATNRIFMGSWINKKAVASTIQDVQPETLWLLPCGRRGHNTQEDLLTAGTLWDDIKNTGETNEIDYSDFFKKTETGLRLMELGYEKDITFCSKEDSLSSVPFFNGEEFRLADNLLSG